MPLKLYEKNNIVDACFKIFITHGYLKTTTAMLADAAGISKALIFHHFKSKKKLYITVLERCFQKMEPDLKDVKEEDYTDFFDFKEKRAITKIEYLQKHPEINKLLYEAFHVTPYELQDEITILKKQLEKKYSKNRSDDAKQMLQLFNKIPFKDSVDTKEAYELIDIISKHFREVLAKELTDKSITDDNYIEDFLNKKRRYIDMIRFGFEKE